MVKVPFTLGASMDFLYDQIHQKVRNKSPKLRAHKAEKPKDDNLLYFIHFWFHHHFAD